MYFYLIYLITQTLRVCVFRISGIKNELFALLTEKTVIEGKILLTLQTSHIHQHLLLIFSV